MSEYQDTSWTPPISRFCVYEALLHQKDIVTRRTSEKIREIYGGIEIQTKDALRKKRVFSYRKVSEFRWNQNETSEISTVTGLEETIPYTQ